MNIPGPYTHRAASEPGTLTVPAYLTTPDGRILTIYEWHPHVESKQPIRVTIEAMLHPPVEGAE